MSDNHLFIRGISQALNERLDHVVKSLFSDRPIHYMNNSIRIGNKGSISVNRGGSKAGVWKSFEDDKGGDIIDLVKYALGYDFKAALSWSRDFLSIQSFSPWPKLTLKQEHSIENNLQRRINKARRIWHNSLPINNSLAETYLRKRGINIPIPPSLKYCPSLEYFCNYKNRYPALVCAVQNKKGKVIALHAVYLDPATAGKVTTEKMAKLSIAPIKGGVVNLSKQSDHLIICEGVEDGLSLVQLYPNLSVVATLGTSGMRNIQIPEHIRKVTVAADANEAGLNAAFYLRERLKEESYPVRIIEPAKGEDFNDFLLNYSNEV